MFECGICGELILNRKNGKRHENCRYWVDQLGEAAAKKHMSQFLQAARVEEAPCAADAARTQVHNLKRRIEALISTAAGERSKAARTVLDVD